MWTSLLLVCLSAPLKHDKSPSPDVPECIYRNIKQDLKTALSEVRTLCEDDSTITCTPQKFMFWSLSDKCVSEVGEDELTVKGAINVGAPLSGSLGAGMCALLCFLSASCCTTALARKKRTHCLEHAPVVLVPC